MKETKQYTLFIESMISSITDLEKASKIVLDTAKHATGSGHGFIGIIEPLNKALIIKSYGGIEEEYLMGEKTSVFYPDENGKYPELIAHAINEKTAFYTNNLKTHPTFKGIPEGHFSIESFMAVPIILGEKVLGLIALANPRKDYTEEDLEKVKEIGRYFALALEHYWLEQELRISEAFYETLFENSPLPILVVEENDLISKVNKAFEGLIEYSREEVVGKMKWQQFVSKEYVEEMAEYKKIRLAGGPAPRRYESKVVDKEGKIHSILIYSRIVPWTRKILAILLDITEEKKMLEKIKEQQKKLEEYTSNLEKMVEEKVKELKEKEMLATLGMMTLMIAHDLRNPLQALSNYNFLLEESMKLIPSQLKERIRKYVQAIDRNIEYMDKIVKDLQYLGKHEIKPEPLDLQTIAEETLKHVIIPENIKIIIEADNIQAKLDPTLVTRALTNLILNSIQSMSEGGTITIQGKQKESMIEFSVIDTGIGMTEEVKRRIFEPFYTTKSKGTGLGLTIVKHIVSLHHGTIEVESEPNKGTKITIKIPIIQNIKTENLYKKQ